MQAAGDNAQMIRALGVNVEQHDRARPGAVERPGRARRARCSRSIRALPTCRWASAWWSGAWPASSSARRWSASRAARPDHRRRGHGLGAVPPAGRDRAARRAQPERPEAGHRGLRVRCALVLPGLLRALARRTPRQAEARSRCFRSARISQDLQPGHAERGARAARRRPDASTTARSSSSSARTARASRRCSTPWPARSSSTRARSRSTAPTSRAGRSTAARSSSAACSRTRSAAPRRRCRSPRTSRWRRGAASRAGSAGR